MDTKIRVTTESWPWRRKFSHRSCRDLNLWPFNHESSALTTELSLLPMCVCACMHHACVREKDSILVCGSLCLVSNAFKYQYLKDINIGRTEQKCHVIANRLVHAHFFSMQEMEWTELRKGVSEGGEEWGYGMWRRLHKLFIYLSRLRLSIIEKPANFRLIFSLFLSLLK